MQDTRARTIEFFLFNALLRTGLIESRRGSNYHQGSRTDKKVSAFENVVSLDVRSHVAPDDQFSKAGVESEIKYCAMLNKVLPSNIRAISWRPVQAQRFSARFDCVDRTYKYYFPRGDLNVERMKEACSYLVGEHDFRNLCKMDVVNGIVNFTRTVYSADIKEAQLNREAIDAFDMFYFEIKASSFLYHMIRYIMSVLLMVGQERESPDVIKELLDVEKKPVKPFYSIANEIPLCLFLCNFREETFEPPSSELDINMLNQWVVDEEALRAVISSLQQHWSFENVKTTMVFDMLRALQAEHSSKFPNFPFAKDQARSFLKDRQKAKLLERATAPTLENKIDHYTRTGKIKKV